MIDYKESIAKAIAETTKLNKESLKQYIEIPPDASMGDYAFPCFKLAKDLHKAPPLIAQEIKDNIKFDTNEIEKAEIIGGYLNFYINKNSITKTVMTPLFEKLINKTYRMYFALYTV